MQLSVYFPPLLPMSEALKPELICICETRNCLSDKKSGTQLYIVFNSLQLDRVNKALNQTCTTVIDRRLANGLNRETGQEMTCLSGLIDFDEEDFEHNICSDLIEVADLELEFDALLQLN